MHWGYGWGMGFGGLIMVVFWVLIILGVVYLIKLIAVGTRDEGKRDTALDILKQRYAKGEITKEELEEKKKDLI
jgi:putative membrane protein